MVKQEVDVSKQEVRFSTTWASPTESIGGLGLSIGLSYAEIWSNRKWMFRNRKSSFPLRGLVLLRVLYKSVLIPMVTIYMVWLTWLKWDYPK